MGKTLKEMIEDVEYNNSLLGEYIRMQNEITVNIRKLAYENGELSVIIAKRKQIEDDLDDMEQEHLKTKEIA